MSEQILPQYPTDFYVYLHRRATTGEVFYVGKGNGKRAWATNKRSAHWKSIVNKSGLIVEIVQDGLLDWAAFELECDLISLYGRKDAGFGPLCNKTDGGEGASGAVRTAEARAKVSAARKGKTLTAETRAKMSAAKKNMSEETKAKFGAAHKGKIISQEQRAKISAARKGRPTKKSTRVYIKELEASFMSASLAHNYLVEIGVKIGRASVRESVIANRSCKGYTFSAYS